MFNWNQIPLVRISFPFIFGIISYHYWQISLGKLLPILAVILIAAFFINPIKFRYKEQYKLGFFYFILVFFAAQAICAFHNKINSSNIDLNDGFYLSQILEHPVEKENSISTELKIISELDSIKLINKTVLVYFEKDENAHNLKVGDQLLINAHFQKVDKPKNPAVFNYANYLDKKYIDEQLYLKSNSYKIVGQSNNFNIIIISKQIQAKIKSIFEEYLKNKSALAILNALVIGDKADLDQEIKSDFSIAGAMHVLAVSGLHVGIIYKVLEFLLKLVFRNRKTKFFKASLLILVLWLYAFITGLSPSVLRAVWMFSFIIIAQLKSNRPNFYNTLAASALLILIINPNFLFHVGFQLSYAAVLGIVSIYPLLYPYLMSQSKVWNLIWALAVVSFSAQIATFGLSLFYFHQFPTYFLLSNFIAIPSAFLLLSLGLLLVGFHFVSVFIAKLIALLIDAVGSFMAFSVQYISALPYSSINKIWISNFQLLFIYVFVFLAIVALSSKNRRWLIVSLIAFTVLIATQIVEDFQKINQEVFIAYSVRNFNSFALINGKDAYVYIDQNYKHIQDEFNYQIQPSLDSLGVNQLYFETSKLNWLKETDIQSNSWIKTKKFNILIRKNDSIDNYLGKLKPQFIFTNQAFENINVSPESTILIGSKLSYWDLKKLKSQTDSSSFIFLKDRGYVFTNH